MGKTTLSSMTTNLVSRASVPRHGGLSCELEPSPLQTATLGRPRHQRALFSEIHDARSPPFIFNSRNCIRRTFR